MINSNEGSPLLDEILRAIGIEYEWSNALLEEKTTISLENIHDYTGLYTSKTGTQFRVSVLDDRLMLHFGVQPPLPIFPSSEVEFFAKAINADICFEKDDDARVVSLTLIQEGNQIKTDKQI